MITVLVLYYSRTGSVAHMANLLARGVESVDGAHAKIRSVPGISTVETAPRRCPAFLYPGRSE